ncbi:hypothetical protein RHMOL_Rhmol04G0261200 [Rhododendron molle]|uniref:Uncharacterized protein n=1 Tax=Rhododendron molle TaxID=49168 RepID=A0ACC0P4N3_RHOML|nr:hypothetical protein RHMOL_Rhmol04G0261200 [Rhododendron molle]
MGEPQGAAENHMDPVKVMDQDEGAYEEEKKVVAVAAEDEGGEDGGADEGGVGVAVVSDEGKDIAGEKDVGIEKEGHELMEETVGVVDGNRIAAAVEY